MLSALVALLILTRHCFDRDFVVSGGLDGKICLSQYNRLDGTYSLLQTQETNLKINCLDSVVNGNVITVFAGGCPNDADSPPPNDILQCIFVLK